MSYFERFLNEDANADAKSDFASILEPETDFYPGALLASTPKALKAAQRDVEGRIKQLDARATIEWNGTIGTVKSDGKKIDRVEIHGATYSDKTGEVAGVRFDATGVRLESATLP